MDSIKQLILSCRKEVESDDVFIEQVNNLIETHGDIIYQAVFELFADLTLSPINAKKYWYGLLTRRTEISQSLGDSISLLAVMCDFLSRLGLSINKLKLVEIEAYENTILHSSHDHLTGLHNRQYILNALEQQIALAQRNQSELSILFIDVDDFKVVNDSYGHGVGDDILKRISSIFSKEIRQCDIVARYGGEEFVVLMPLTSSIEALILADRVREYIEQEEFHTNGKAIPVTISGGIASFPVNAKKADELINIADSALYRAKGAGKNNISLFTEDNRRFLRIDLIKPIKIKELGFSHPQSCSGVSKDICVGGILFENQTPLDIGTKIQVSIPIVEDEPVLLIGTVVRVEVLAEHRYDIGVVIAFKEMEKLAKNEISRFLINQARKSF